MKTLRFISIIACFCFLQILSLAAADQAAAKSICILGECEESEMWQAFLRKNGISDAHIISWDSFTQEKTGALIIHNTSFANSGKSMPVPADKISLLKDFISKGGRILAIEKAGFTGDTYSLTEILKAGKRTMTIPILYPGFIDYNAEKLTEMAKGCMSNGSDGIAFFTYMDLCIQKWRPKKPDLTATAKKIYSSINEWKSKDSGNAFLGLPDTSKVIYVSGLWVTGPRYTTSPEELVEYAKTVGANVICFSIWGGDINMTPYDSAYLAKNNDYLPNLIEQCKKYDIQVWANIPAMKATLFKPYCRNLQISDRGIISGKICPVAAQEYYCKMLKLVEELLSKHPYINVLSLDEPGLGGGKKDKWRCFCPECKKLFYQKYGKELLPENVISGKKGEKISREFNEFRENTMMEYYFKPLKMTLDKIRPGIQLLVWNPIGQEIGAINPQKLADSGINIILGTEFQTRIDGPSRNTLRWKTQYFDFENLFLEGRELKSAGQGLKIDVFNGANVTALMKNGDYKYPAIVSANNGKTLYFCFNPLAYTDSSIILLIKKFLEEQSIQEQKIEKHQ